MKKLIFVTVLVALLISKLSHAEAPNCLCELYSGNGSEYTDYIRLSSSCRKYSFYNTSYCPCSDFEGIINNAANKWENSCLTFSEDSMSDYIIMWVVTPGKEAIAETSKQFPNGIITSWYINFYQKDENGQDRSFNCSNECNGVDENLMKIAMHEFGHVIGLQHPLEGSSLYTVMKQGACRTSLSSNDIDARDYLYPCEFNEGHSWGDIKSIYADASLGTTGMNALSSNDNTIVWHNFGEGNSNYRILRSVDEQDEVNQIGVNSYGDTIYIDDDIDFGHTYHYRIASPDGDTLYYSNSYSAGLRTTGEINYTDEGWPSAIVTNGDYVYLATGDNPGVLKKVDISNPANPVEVGYGLNEMYLFCVDYTDFYVIDIEDNNMPVTGAIYDIGGGPVDQNCSDLAIDGYTAYVACNKNGLIAIDISHPDSPEVWSTYYGPGNPGDCGFNGVELVDGYLYVSE